MAAAGLAPGALVWAKFGGYPWWPAARADESSPDVAADKPGGADADALLVRFFGTLEYAWMAGASVQPFAHNREARARAQKPASLRRAVAQALAYEASGATPPGWAVQYVPLANKAAAEAGKAKGGGAAGKAKGKGKDAAAERRLRVARTLGLAPPEGSPWARVRGAAAAPASSE